MIDEWRLIAYRERAPHGAEFDAWCEKQDWYRKDDEYSRLFELLYLDPISRQKYIETKIKDAFPGWGYLYLANMVGDGRFNVVFTTNFDDLVNDALTVFLGYNPVVCSADSEVSTINITSERAKIIKLHGDYLFESIRNTVGELHQLDPNMERKFKEFATQCGLVVLGYAGRDQSIMRVFEEVMGDARAFPHGVYWGVRPGSDIGTRVQNLATQYSKRFHLFECPDFDFLMARLHDERGLSLPKTIIEPYRAVNERYRRLLTSAAGNLIDDPTIQAHMKTLESELNRTWATANADDFDLLQAQLALGRRDHKSALALIAGFVERLPESAEGWTTWGDALALRGEEESSEALNAEAVTKWRKAIQIQPDSLPPHYSLARYYGRNRNIAEGIAACEELLKHAPNDVGMRVSLVQLCTAASRFDIAQRELEWLLRREPNSADFHAMCALIFEQRGLVPQAIEEIRFAVSLAPKNPWFRFQLAQRLATTGHIEEAAAEFEEAIGIDPRNLNFRISAASFYLNRQTPAGALPHLQAAVSIEPQSGEARGWLCQTLTSLGQYHEAQAEGEEGVRLSPRDSRIRVVTGTAYLQANRPDLAEQHFRAATQTDPNAPSGYYALCSLYRMQCRSVELDAALEQLERLDPPAAQMFKMQALWQPTPSSGAPNWQGALPKRQGLALTQARTSSTVFHTPGAPNSPQQAQEDFFKQWDDLIRGS
jgi:tetratricopeptide (TPR) repeat protein